MASKRKAFLSRSVSLSLAALIVLTGAMFLITTLEQDHQEWKLVEDEVLDLVSVSSSGKLTDDIDVVYTWEFDDETSTYQGEMISGTKVVSDKYQVFVLKANDSFPFDADVVKFVFVSDFGFQDFNSNTNGVLGPAWFNLRSVASDDDGVYTATLVCHKQIIEDLKYKDGFWASNFTSNSNTTDYTPLSFSCQVYVLEDDNAGSVAAAITGLTLIVMGVFATPMLNVLRRR